MRARPNISGEQLVQEYLAQVAQAARLLPKGARMAFVSRTRAIIEREVGPVEVAEAGRVRAVLEAMGPPEDLVKQERIRIDAKWLKGRAGTKEAGEAAAASLNQPLNRSLRARRRPGPAGLQPLSGRIIPPPPGRSGTRPGASRPAGSPASGPAAAGPPPAAPLAGPRAGPPRAGPHAAVPAGTAPEDGANGSVHYLTGQGPDPHSPPGESGTLLTNAGRLARGHILETVAILTLGLGGLVLPFPFWPVGAVVALFSRLWDIKDKAVAVTGPLLVTLAASVLTAVFIGGSGNFILVYGHALHVGFGLLVRVGSVVTAAYLAWRVSRGPRAKVPPWKRITRS